MVEEKKEGLEEQVLRTYIAEEEIIVENKQAFAYSSLLNSKRKINGCKARAYLDKKISAHEKLKVELENKLKEVTSKLTQYQSLDNQLAGAGYCKIDTPIYQKIDGIVMRDSDGNAKISSYTHTSVCAHKKEE